jgi:hypothetical protein
MPAAPLTNRLLVPSVAAVSSALAAAAIWVATAAASGAPAVTTNGFAGPVQGPPRPIERLLGPTARAGMTRVRCAGEPAGAASCYVAVP